MIFKYNNYIFMIRTVQKQKKQSVQYNNLTDHNDIEIS